MTTMQVPKHSPSAADINITKPLNTEKHTIHWFRKGLRMHDNPSLKEGLKDCLTFRCVFILDPWFAGSSNVGINKWRFLLQCLEDLDFNLRKLNSRLFVIRGQPADILPKLFKEWKTTCLTFEEDPEPFGKVRDQNIRTLCEELNIQVISRVSHTLYDLDQIIEKNSGKTPVTYHQFQNIVATMSQPPFADSPVTHHIVINSSTPVTDDHDEKYGVPTLEELGFDIDGLLPAMWKGGETEATRRLERHLERKAWVASFGRPKMTPQSLLASQTGLSPYLRFGCLSTRLFYHELNKLYKRIKKAQPPLSLHGQLLWREFFYCAATRNPNFDRMMGNPICVQIPWDTNAEALAKWANAQTGFPWIDSIMTQLREEGWIHHLARHAVACFLTRGDLWVSWEEGMKIFDELLLDADWSVNAGMWMWLSCSSFFQQFFHCYCPVKFGRKADPNGEFVRRYLPALKNMPTKYIHEPWIAPIHIQKASKCVIGQDYPLPMVNHPLVSKINIERIKQVYRQLANYKGTVQISKEGTTTTISANIISLEKHIHQSNNDIIQSNKLDKEEYNIQQHQHHHHQTRIDSQCIMQTTNIKQIIENETYDQNTFITPQQINYNKSIINNNNNASTARTNNNNKNNIIQSLKYKTNIINKSNQFLNNIIHKPNEKYNNLSDITYKQHQEQQNQQQHEKYNNINDITYKQQKQKEEQENQQQQYYKKNIIESCINETKTIDNDMFINDNNKTLNEYKTNMTNTNNMINSLNTVANVLDKSMIINSPSPTNDNINQQQYEPSNSNNNLDIKNKYKNIPGTVLEKNKINYKLKNKNEKLKTIKEDNNELEEIINESTIIEPIKMIISPDNIIKMNDESIELNTSKVNESIELNNSEANESIELNDSKVNESKEETNNSIINDSIMTDESNNFNIESSSPSIINESPITIPNSLDDSVINDTNFNEQTNDLLETIDETETTLNTPNSMINDTVDEDLT